MFYGSAQPIPDCAQPIPDCAQPNPDRAQPIPDCALVHIDHTSNAGRRRRGTVVRSSGDLG